LKTYRSPFKSIWKNRRAGTKVETFLDLERANFARLAQILCKQCQDLDSSIVRNFNLAFSTRFSTVMLKTSQRHSKMFSARPKACLKKKFFKFQNETSPQSLFMSAIACLLFGRDRRGQLGNHLSQGSIAL
jgi:hypothetical protein